MPLALSGEGRFHESNRKGKTLRRMAKLNRLTRFGGINAMAPIRTKNRFGRRYIRLKELCDYAVDLDLYTHPPGRGLMEFLEVEGLLTPVRRIEIPPEILRRFTRESYPDVDIVDPVEPDGPRLDAVADLMQAIGRWADARIYGKSTHALDALDDAHLPFIQTDFSPGTFTSWEDRRVRLYQTDGGPILSNPDQDTPTFYHYWQIFCFLRSCARACTYTIRLMTSIWAQKFCAVMYCPLTS